MDADPLKNNQFDRRRRALTLVELLVVLVILAVVTIVAVQSTEFLVDQARYTATQQTLQNVQNAIMGPPNQIGANGSPSVAGFIADMGRLPIYATGTSSGDPLAELWDPVAVAANNGAAFSATGDPLSAKGITIPSRISTQTGAAQLLLAAGSPYYATIPCGWRGPYLQLPAGATRPLDGWGNPFQSIYQAPGVTTYPPTAPPTVGFPVNAVCSIGSDNAFDTAVPTVAYAQDQYVPAQTTVPPTMPLVNFSQSAYGAVMVTVQAINPGTAPPATSAVTNPYPSSSPGTETTPMVRIVLFAPVNGAMTSFIMDSTSGTTSLPAAPYFTGSPLVTPADFAINPAGAPSVPYLSATTPVQGSFFKVPIGPRAIQAFQYEGSTTSANYMVITKRSPLTYLTVTPNSTLTPTLILQ